MRRFIFFLIVCEFFSLACIAANKTIKGHIVDEFGKNVEFASVYARSLGLRPSPEPCQFFESYILYS